MRALRVLFVANDGASVGHVTRAVAVARALLAEAGRRGIAVEALIATTSGADAVLAWSGIPSVRVPHPGLLAEAVRRPLAAGVLAAVLDGFRPDALVVDTFPCGPHLELSGLVERVPHRFLVRRTIRPERAGDAVVAAGLDAYDAVVAPDDPGPVAAVGVRVPPIVLDARAEPRDAARAALGGPSGTWVVAATGGRGDTASGAFARAVRAWCAERGAFAVVADGLLDPGERPAYPLARWLRAFDAAVVPAGYNSAHECATVGVPSVLYARPRAFDDQAARARRFAAAGLAVALDDPDGLPAALDRVLGLAPPPLACDGARATAAIVLDRCAA